MAVSPKQLNANRRNSQLSTGPRTPEGKAASSHNASRHGLLSQQLIAPTEDVEEYDTLVDELKASLDPLGAMEVLLVEEIAGATWRLRRVRAAETDLFSGLLERTGPQAPLPFPDGLALIQRYEKSLEMTMHRCLTDLMKLQAPRKKAEMAERSDVRIHGAAISHVTNRLIDESAKRSRLPLEKLGDHRIDNMTLREKVERLLIEPVLRRSPGGQPVGYYDFSPFLDKRVHLQKSVLRDKPVSG